MMHFGTFLRRLAAQVGHALFGDQHLDRVLAVVDMADHRDNRRDAAILLSGRTSIDREVSVAGEIARTTDTIHHFRAEHMSGVDIAINIGLECGVDRNQTETADDFRVVGNLDRAENQLVAEIVHIVVDILKDRLSDSERAAAGKEMRPSFISLMTAS